MVILPDTPARLDPHLRPYTKSVGATSGSARMALYADAPLSEDMRGQLISYCRRRGASLLILAPVAQALAASILETLLPTLEHAGIGWSVVPLSGEPVKAARAFLAAHPGIRFVACDGRSGLAESMLDDADSGHVPAVSILLCLFGEPAAATRPPASFPEIDWLRPDLNRGF